MRFAAVSDADPAADSLLGKVAIRARSVWRVGGRIGAPGGRAGAGVAGLLGVTGEIKTCAAFGVG
jgi:hypothetical protein